AHPRLRARRAVGGEGAGRDPHRADRRAHEPRAPGARAGARDDDRVRGRGGAHARAPRGVTVPAPMRLDVVSEFPYKHSTGEVIGRFLAGLREQKRIWGQRVPGQGVVVPPLGYSEADGSAGGEWVEVKPTGVLSAVAIGGEPTAGRH